MYSVLKKQIFVRGKIIIFGEHSVVYGAPAIALPISKGIYGVLTPGIHSSINLNSNLLNEVSVFNQALERMAKLIPSKSFKLDLVSDIPAGAGLGFSAAFSVLLAKSAAFFSDVKLNNNVIHEAAHEIERLFHSAPSGVDDSVVFYEKSVLFQKKRIDLNMPWSGKLVNPQLMILDTPTLPVCVGYSGESSKTKVMVHRVNNSLSDKEKATFVKSMTLKFEDGIKRWSEHDFAAMGIVMNSVQAEYVSMGLSTAAIDKMAILALENGAWGAKLTGGGGGGSIIALVDKKNRRKVEESWKSAGFSVVD
jgi:mevalonate kinase